MNLRNIFCKNFLLSLVLLLATQRLSAVSYYVAPTIGAPAGWNIGSNTNDGLSQITPYATLAYLFSQKNLASGDIVYVAAGTYSEKNITPGTDDEGFTIEGAALDGSGNPTSIFDGNSTGGSWMLLNNYQCDGITIKYLNIKRYTANTIASNEGGGFIRSKIGISGESITNLKIISCLVDECKGNSSQFGGAICFRNYGAPSLEVLGTRFQNCTADGDGGVIDFASTNTAGGELIINKSIFNNNSCGGNGYAVKISSVATINLSIINSLFYSNSSTYSAGYGVILTDAYTIANIINCTIYNNTASSPISAGIYSFGTTNVTNCIIYNNSVKDFYEAGGTLTVSYSNYKNTHSSANVITSTTFTSNPNLTVDFHLSSGSPCINTGTGTPGTSPYPNDDLDGDPRAGAIDIGCYEFDCTTTYAGTYIVGTGGTWQTLTAAIADLKSCMIDDVILELNESYRTTNEASETYPLNFYGMPTSASITLTIRPKGDITNVITLDGNPTTTLIDFNGTDYVTFDGRPGGTSTNKYIIIENTSTSTGGSAVKLSNDATNNTFRYCTLKSSFTSATEGVINFSTTTESSGNDNNTISYCVIDGKAASSPSPTSSVAQNGIYSSGTASKTNSNNTVSYCEFKDVFVTGSTSGTYSSYFINIGSNNDAWSIINNSFYQTATRTATNGVSSGTTNFYSINTLSGDGYTIHNNYFGGSAANCTGTWTQGSASTSSISNIYCINLTGVGTSTGTTLNGNTFARFSHTQLTTDVFKAINATAGKLEIGTTTGNIIGSTSGAGSITFITGASTNGTIVGIDVSSSSTVNIKNNTIGSITVSNAANRYVTFTGIKTTSLATYDISNNVIANSDVAGSITLGGSSPSGSFTAIGNTGTGVVNITVNTIGSINSNIGNFTGILDNAAAGTNAHIISNNTIGTNSSGTSSIYLSSASTMTNRGIYIQSTGTNYAINNNTIRNITSIAGGYIIGIASGSTGTYNMSGNKISNLIGNVSGSTACTIAGIYFEGNASSASPTLTIEKNRMTGFENNSYTTAGIYGIFISTRASTYLIYNNLFICSNGSNTNSINIFGIGEPSPATWTDNSVSPTVLYNVIPTIRAYYNTIEISGSQNTSGTNFTAPFFHSGGTANKVVALKNNIFKNTRTNAGSGTPGHYCYYIMYTGSITSGECNYNYYSAPVDSKYANYGGDKTSTQFNSNIQGMGGTSSVFAGAGGANAVTINTDGSLSSSDLAIVGRGVLLASPCDVDINFFVRATSGGLGGFKGCYEGNCLVVSTHPLNSTICPTQTYSPSIVITNSAGSAVDLTFQLQYSTDNASFSNVSNGTPSNASYSSGNGSASGVSANTNSSFNSTVTGNLPFGSSYYYRYSIVASTGCAINTNSAQLTVTVTPQVNSTLSNGDFVWAGLSTSWSTTSNWQTYNGTNFSTATIQPSSSDRVIISAPNSCVTAQPILGSDITIGSLIIESGATLDASTDNRSISLSGDWTNNGTFTERLSTVTFTGGGTIGGTNSTTFNNLTINHSTASTDTLTSNQSVKNTLNLTSGKLNVGSKLLTLGTSSSNATINGGGPSSFIVTGEIAASDTGKVKQFINSNATYRFPIGDASNYTPLNFTLNSSSLSNASLIVHSRGEKVPSLNYNNTLATFLNRYWKVQASGISSPSYSVSYTYASADVTGVEDSLLPIKLSGSTWYKPTGSSFLNASSEGLGSLVINTNTLTWSGLSSFSFFGGAGNTSNVLPISLNKFSVNCQVNKSLLNWSTTSELNNDYFTIEKSNDGVAFTELAKVKGSGTTTVEQNYSFIDELKNEGNSYYQLFQTDYNGDKKWVAMEIANCNEIKGLINVFPNPNNGQFVISGIQPDMIISIIDVLGRTIYQVTSNEKNQEIYLQNLPSGFYTVKCENKSQIYSLKIVVE